MKDRGMIKWQPFDAVTSSKKVIQHILAEKNKVAKPCMSEEQLKEMEEKILEGYHNQIQLEIIYFFKGRWKVKKDVLISQISFCQKRILCHDGTILYFDQLLQVRS